MPLTPWSTIASLLQLNTFSGPTMSLAQLGGTASDGWLGSGGYDCVSINRDWTPTAPPNTQGRVVWFSNTHSTLSGVLPGRHNSEPSVYRFYIYRCYTTPHRHDLISPHAFALDGYICTRFVGRVNGMLETAQAIRAWINQCHTPGSPLRRIDVMDAASIARSIHEVLRVDDNLPPPPPPALRPWAELASLLELNTFSGYTMPLSSTGGSACDGWVMETGRIDCSPVKSYWTPYVERSLEAKVLWCSPESMAQSIGIDLVLSLDRNRHCPDSVYVYRHHGIPHQPDLLSLKPIAVVDYICTRYAGPENGMEDLARDVRRWIEAEESPLSRAITSSGAGLSFAVTSHGTGVYAVHPLPPPPPALMQPDDGLLPPPPPALLRSARKGVPKKKARKRKGWLSSRKKKKKTKKDDDDSELILQVNGTDDEGKQEVVYDTDALIVKRFKAKTQIEADLAANRETLDCLQTERDDEVSNTVEEIKKKYEQHMDRINSEQRKLTDEAVAIDAEIKAKVDVAVDADRVACSACFKVVPSGHVRCGNPKCHATLCLDCWVGFLNAHLDKIWTAPNKCPSADLIEVMLDKTNLRVCVHPPKCGWCKAVPSAGIPVDDERSALRRLRYMQLKQCDPEYEKLGPFLPGRAEDLTDEEWFHSTQRITLRMGELNTVVHLRYNPDAPLLQTWSSMVSDAILANPALQTIYLTCPYHHGKEPLSTIIDFHNKEVPSHQLLKDRPKLPLTPTAVKYWLAEVLRTTVYKPLCELDVVGSELRLGSRDVLPIVAYFLTDYQDKLCVPSSYHSLKALAKVVVALPVAHDNDSSSQHSVEY